MDFNALTFGFCVSTAGYNNLEVAEYLLQHGAEVNSQDKGGLIPLHNAASYGVSLRHAFRLLPFLMITNRLRDAQLFERLCIQIYYCRLVDDHTMLIYIRYSLISHFFSFALDE